jgi:GT2 family glycosyltransferase/glycosyltransferase involved in cell wall biosynthesis
MSAPELMNVPALVCLHLDPVLDPEAALPAWWRALPKSETVLAVPPSCNLETTDSRVVMVAEGAGIGAVLAALHAAFPDRDIAYVRAGAEPAPNWVALLARVAHADPRVGAALPLSDCLDVFSPFDGVRTDALGPALIQRWLQYLADDLVFEVPVLLPVCGYFRAPALAALASAGELSDVGNLAARFRARGWSCVACDRVFVGGVARDPDFASELAAPDVQVFLATHPLAALRQALARELGGGVAVPPPVAVRKPVQLHITHSWGGGVGHWVQAMCEADTARDSLVLRSLGNSTAYAYRLALYGAADSAMPLREWRLDFPICSIAATHYQYRQILTEVARDFQVDLMIVSSLIGHSLDALATGLPTLVVQHDFFPFCPALSIHFREVCTRCDGERLRACFVENPLNRLFANADAEHWLTIRRRWLDLLHLPGVRVVAPSQGVLRHLRELAPAVAELAAVVVPNGCEPLPRLSGEPDAGRLRILVLGSLALPKGADLLRQALPALGEFADLHLLGTGRDGKEFEGLAGVQVTRAYELAELPARVAAIDPHVGLLLSIVPETFSYTLSELWMLGVPPVATHLGAFAERIEHGRTGWLIEPSAAALVAQLRELDAQRGLLREVRKTLSQLPVWTRTEMIEAYHALTPELAGVVGSRRVVERDGRDGRIERLAEMVSERDVWINHLDSGIAERDERIGNLNQGLAERDRSLAERDRSLANLEQTVIERDARIARLDRAVAERDEWLAAMYNSRSWRITAPLRWLAARMKRWLIPMLRHGKAMYMRLPFGAQTVSGHRRVLIRHAPWLLRLASVRPESITPSVSNEIIGPTAPVAPEWYTAVNPRVSIVIVAFNKSEYTIECLRSIWANTAGISYEVILVDNGSEAVHCDRVRPYLGPAQFLELGTNRGFGEGNNIGVERAAGEFVVLLNNDVTVAPNWLAPLVGVMDAHADAGAVGVRLVYPDGVLQEAGAYLRADGTAYQRGKGECAATSAYDALEVVDYCSAAAVLVRKEIFLRVLGFDLCYDPAYYEDSDLCLKMEAMGFRTYYCPETTVIHHEGATSRDASLNQGLHNVVEVNRQKFLARWQDRLRAGPPGTAVAPPLTENFAAPVSGPARIGAAAAPALRVGLYTPYNILPGGGERYLLSIAEALQGFADVELVASHPWSRLRLLTTARELGVEVGNIRPVTVAEARGREPYDIFVAMGNEIVPPIAPLGKRNVFHCQFPFPVDRQTIAKRRGWLKGYGSIIVNSHFTQHHVRDQLARGGLDTSLPVEVIAPPVVLLTNTERVKLPIILNVGRFFLGGHNKKQLDMVRAFKRIIDQGRGEGWELHLAGAAHPELEHREYLLKIIEEAQGYPIKIHVNPPLSSLRKLYHEASLYWHATGFDIDENRFPDQHEHFGITTVEAMSAGCIPIVVATAGQREIVQDGENGFLWRSLTELQDKTAQVIADFGTAEIQTMRANAVRRAGEFSSDVFADHVRRHFGLS